MPPKPKPSKAPASKIRPNQIPDSSANEKTASGLPQEAEDQFELELCWCINQLCTYDPKSKVHSTSGHIEKQARDLEKSLNVLRSNTAPLIKKRQIMRQIFGNYREKMVQDEQKLGKAASSVKFTSRSMPNKKSVFLRRANNAQRSVAELKEDLNTPSPNSEECAHELTNNQRVLRVPFKFNFQKQDCS